MHRRWIASSCLFGALALAAGPAFAQWSGPLTEPWWGIPGGGQFGTGGGSYRLAGAAGLPIAAPLTGGVFRVSAGIWVQPGGGAPTAVDPHPLPTVFAFASPAPDPFAEATTLAFDLPAGGPVLGEVFDVRGQRVRTLIDGVRQAGRYRDVWDGRTDTGRRLGAGVYFVRLRSVSGEATRRVVRIE